MRSDQNQLHWSQTAVQAGDTVSGTTNETIFASKPQVFSADSLKVGDVVRFIASGVFSTQVLNVSTFTLRMKLGTTDIFTASAVSVGALALTNSAWQFTGEFHVRSIGASGSVEGFASATFSSAVSTQVAQLLGNTAAITVDTTADIQFQISAQLSISAGVNAITMRRCMTEQLLA